MAINALIFVIEGDPDDQSLRKVEREIVIPKMMKEKAAIRCGEFVKGKLLISFYILSLQQFYC